MREMKDSGERWIGAIPESWKVLRGKAILTILERPIRDDDGIITCFRDGEVTLRSNRRVDGFTMSDQEIGYQGIEPGDLVVHGMDGFAGSIGISDSRGKGTPVLNVMDSTQNKKFLMYYLRTMAFSGVFISLSTGIRVRSCDTNWNKLKSIMYLIPPIDEQRRIADFLDRKCTDIDNVLEKTKASIEEYKKLKQSVITEAVTKGIRGERTVKDSGIEWIGEIPEDWQHTKLKNILSGIQDGTHGTFARCDSGRPLLSAKNVQNEKIVMGDNESYISEDDYREIVANGYPRRGDILFCCIGGSIGKCAIYGFDEPFAFQRSVAFVRVSSNTNNKFIYYLFHSKPFAHQYTLNANVSAQAGIYMGALKEFDITLPFISEQDEIASYLDRKCSEIDSLIESKERLIKELEAYRKSLIYEYVTGKKEVNE